MELVLYVFSPAIFLTIIIFILSLYVFKNIKHKYLLSLGVTIIILIILTFSGILINFIDFVLKNIYKFKWTN